MIFQQGPPPVPQPPPKAPKRRAPENEDATAGTKSKKPKAKGKSAADGAVAGSMFQLHNPPHPDTQFTGDTGTSKRGYNAKKRSEAAQIAAQNGTSHCCSLSVSLLIPFSSSTDAVCVVLTNI
jgi:lysine-specific demethylase 3